jgi:hypothetical protein
MIEDVESGIAPGTLRDARRALREKFGKPEKTSRKAKEKKVQSAVDGRTLRAKGRTVQLNVNVRPEFKEGFTARAAAEGISAADLMERVLEAFLRGAK